MEIRVDTYMEDFRGQENQSIGHIWPWWRQIPIMFPGRRQPFCLWYRKFLRISISQKALRAGCAERILFLTDVEKAEWETAKRRKKLRIQRQKAGFWSMEIRFVWWICIISKRNANPGLPGLWEVVGGKRGLWVFGGFSVVIPMVWQ